MRIENEKQCSTQPSQLFPEVRSCPNKPTEYIFGDPYCKSCADKLREIHALMCKSK
jgi:hypothetical protein